MVAAARGRHRPARLVHPLALIEAVLLMVASVAMHDAAALARAGLAALIGRRVERVVVAVARPNLRARKMPVPLRPALVLSPHRQETQTS